MINGYLVMINEKAPPLKKMSFMSILTISQGHRDCLLTQKEDGLGHNIHIIDS